MLASLAPRRQEIKQRQAARTTEMIWAPSPTLGDAGSTYAGILYGGYCTVPGLSMDFFSDDAPIQDDARLEDYNVASIVNATVATVLDALSKVPQGGSATADIMLPLGCDFEWENAGSWFDNTDRLIHYRTADHADRGSAILPRRRRPSLSWLRSPPPPPYSHQSTWMAASTPFTRRPRSTP